MLYIFTFETTPNTCFDFDVPILIASFHITVISAFIFEKKCYIISFRTATVMQKPSISNMSAVRSNQKYDIHLNRYLIHMYITCILVLRLQQYNGVKAKKKTAKKY